MKNFRPHVGILTEGTAITSFLQTIRSVFAPASLQPIAATDLANAKIIKKLDLLVLPGVTGEDSPYPRFLNRDTIKCLDEGLNYRLAIWASCAAGYGLSNRYSYRSPYKTALQMRGAGFLAGEAVGPVDHANYCPDLRDRFSDTRVLRVSFNHGARGRHVTGVCYGNGGAYFPASGEEPSLDPIARFADIPGEPLAIVNKHVRNGLVSFHGVLPEIAESHMRMIGKPFPSVRRLRHEFNGHESGRIQLMNVIVQKFQDHWQQREWSIAS